MNSIRVSQQRRAIQHIIIHIVNEIGADIQFICGVLRNVGFDARENGSSIEVNGEYFTTN